MATSKYQYNILLNVKVNDKELNRLENRIKQYENRSITFKPKFDETGTRRYWKNQTGYIRNFQKEQSALAKNMSNFARDYSRSATELNRSVSSFRGVNSLGRRMGVAREKGSRLMDIGAGIGSYVGISSLKKILYDTPVQAETNKWLMSTMGDNTATSTELYNTLDVTTDKLPISMQSVAQPLYAFKAATGANAETIKKMIPQFANFGAVVQNMTGSTELAETAMMKLSYGIKGRYAALDQYGITEASLLAQKDENGKQLWSGDETDLAGYMAAVTKIVGNAEDSMSTFAGQVKLIEKSLARTGKQIWENGLGDALKGAVSGINAFLNAGGGIFAKLGLFGVTAAGGILGLTAATGYLLQAFGSMGESLLLLKSTVGDTINSIATLGGRGHAVGRISSLESKLAQQQNPVYIGGIHDYNKHQLANSGFSDRQMKKINKSKKRDKDFVHTFGYGKEAERQMRAIKSDPTMTRQEKVAARRKVRKSRLNELNNMGWYGRYKSAGRVNTLRAGVGAFKQGWSGGSGLGKLTGGFSQLGGVLGSVVGVINPLNIAMGAFAAVLVLLTSVFATAYMSSESFRQHVSRVGQKLMELGQTVMGFIGDVFQMTGISTEGGISGVVEVADKILSALEGGIDWLKGVMEGFTGKDYKAEQGYKEASDTIKKTEAQADEYKKQGKEVPKELIDTLKWAYSRQDYFSAPNYAAEHDSKNPHPTQGGYWKDKGGKYDQLRAANPGWEIDDYANPTQVLKQNAQYQWGDLGLFGVGQSRDYLQGTVPVNVVNWNEQDTEAFVQSERNNNPVFASGDQKFDMEAYKTASESANNFAISLDSIDLTKMSSLGDTSSSIVQTGQGTANLQKQSAGLDGQSLVNSFHSQVTTGVANTMNEANNTISSNAGASAAAGSSVGTAASSSLNDSMKLMPTYANTQASRTASSVRQKSPAVSGATSSMGSTASDNFGSNFDITSWVGQEIQWATDKVNELAPMFWAALSALAAGGQGATEAGNNNNSPGNIANWAKQEVIWMAEAVRDNQYRVHSAFKTLSRDALPSSLSSFGSLDYNLSTVADYMEKNPVDLYKRSKANSLNSQPLNAGDKIVKYNNETQPVINITVNVTNDDSKNLANEIAETVRDILFYNNETAGRQDPVPLV